jgi:PKD repeat protein
VKKLSQTGCDMVILLENGTILNPAEIVPSFTLKDGQYVQLSFEKYAEKTTNCKEGFDAKILTIKALETPAETDCKFELFVKSKTETANTFFFYTASKAVIKTWKWNFGDGKTSDAKEVIHVYEKAGIYEVTCTITTKAGCTEKVSIKHTVNSTQLPICKGATSLTLFDPKDNQCNGKAIIKLLNDTGKVVENVKYLWSTGQTTSKVDNLCLNKPYAVQVLVENSCQKNLSFTLLSQPLWKTTSANGLNTFSVLEPVEGVNYEWNFGNGNTLKGAEVNYIFAEEGVYDVTLTASGGINKAEYSQLVVINNTSTSANYIGNTSFNIYPNPVVDKLIVDFGKELSGNYLLEISNSKGQRTYSQHLVVDGYTKSIVDVQKLKKGVYIVKLSKGQETIAYHRFVKAE